MTNTNLIKRTVETIRRFKDETQGNIAIIFALMTIPLFLLMGFAIDLQQVNTAKNRVQFILDSAVIAGAREMQEGKNDTEIKTYIENYFKSAMKAQGKGTDCAEPVASIASESQDLSVKVRCAQPTSIMQMTGTKELNFSVTSASTYGIGKVDIAFVFDISGSMGGSKMSALKSAADTAINVLVPADDDGTTGEVRIGMASYSSMVDAGEDYFFKATGQLPIRTYTFSYDETYESGGDWEEVCKWKKKRGRWYWTCDDEWVPNYATRTVTETKTINNTCVKERVGDEQFTDEDPGPFQWIEAAEAYGSVNWRGDVSWYTESCNPIGPLPMTSNRDKLFDYIDGLNASGGTAGLGLVSDCTGLGRRLARRL